MGCTSSKETENIVALPTQFQKQKSNVGRYAGQKNNTAGHSEITLDGDKFPFGLQEVTTHLTEYHVTVIDCANRQNSNELESTAVQNWVRYLISALREDPQQKYEVIFPEHPNKIENQDNDDLRAIEQVLTANTWNSIRNITMNGDHSIQQTLQESTCQYETELSKGDISDDQAMQELQQVARDQLQSFFLTGFDQMTGEDYLEEMKKAHKDGSAQTINISHIIKTIQDKQLRICEKRMKTRKALPKNRHLIFVLPGVPHDLAATKDHIKEAQTKFAECASQGFSFSWQFAYVTQNKSAIKDMGILDDMGRGKKDNVDCICLDPKFTQFAPPRRLICKVLAGQTLPQFEKCSSDGATYYTKLQRDVVRRMQTMPLVKWEPLAHVGDPPAYAESSESGNGISK